jgi:acetylornithine/N-succinyldiaminopimelate aminotransferase
MTANRLMNVYNRAEPLFVRGRGPWLYTETGESWLDCVSGIATNALGHAPPILVDALTRQAGDLWHLSNMFRVAGQERLAEKLCAASFADRVFFANSGAEAVECALKLARRYHSSKGQGHRNVVYGLPGAFHGRTYATINAAGNRSYLEGFGPALPGFATLDLEDHGAVEAALAAPETAAVIVEPVQGEGGARAVPFERLRRLRQDCSKRDVLLIFDEVQCGMGRTGRLFAHQWHPGCEPDMMTLAKALGGGFPVGACLATEAAAAGMAPGSHGSTFGGAPLAMAVAEAAFDAIADDGFLRTVEATAERLRTGLEAIARRRPEVVRELRGRGLLIGVALRPDNRAFMAAARDRGLLVAGGGDNIVRLLPPLNLTAAEADEVLTRFEATCADVALAEAA